MRQFKVHSKKSAPVASGKFLSNAEQTFGFVPNLLGVFAESPAVLEAYLSLGRILDDSSLTPVERQVAILAVSRVNECAYCIAAHSVIAGMHKVPAQVINALREDTPIAEERLQALRVFTTAVVEKRGWVADGDIAAFEAAGFTRAQVLEVILAVSFKTLSNYVNHIAKTPLDSAFARHAWAPPEIQAAG